MTATAATSGPILGTVVLMGLMGSGKSTIGALVAERTGRILIDVDDQIHARTGMTTRKLWEQAGEAGYRPLERDISVGVLTEGGPVVLALPGGVIEEPLVVAAITASTPFTVWLRAQPLLLAARVASSDHRPLVAGDPAALLERQHRERSPHFEAVADLVIDIDALDAEQAANLIIDGLRARADDRRRGTRQR